MSLTEAAEEEAARQVHATHERIVTESDPKLARRRPSERIAADTVQALKDSRKISRSQSLTGGSSEGTGVSPGVPNESTVIPATSSEGISTKPGVIDKEKVTSEAKTDVILDWGSEQESEYSGEDQDDDDADDDKSINLEKTDNEETDDEFMHSEEYIQDDDEETDDELVHGDEQVNDDEDEKMTNAEDADTGNSDEEINDAAKADAERQKKDTFFCVEPLVLTPIPETPLAAPATTLLPLPSVSIIPPVLLQSTTPIITPPITTEAPPVIMIPDPLLQVDYKEMIEESVQANLINEVKNQLPKFLPNVVFYLATPVIQSTINKALEKTLTTLAQSSSLAQSFLKATESLSEYELKTILFEKMDKSCSYLKHDKHQVLFDALLNSMMLLRVVKQIPSKLREK
ncbi:hypothetical protein Tco_1133393 [Tanacetum coccineum]